MKLDEITRIKNALARAGAVFAVLFVLFGADGAIAYLRHPFNTLDMLPGETTSLTGPMAPGVQEIGGMLCESSSAYLTLTLDEVISGFWMGGRMWRGTLRLDGGIEPGKYTVSVFGREDGQRVGSNIFQVVVYPDRAARIAGSKSLIERTAGISPWTVSAGFFGMVLLMCGSLYFVSGKRDRLMADAGEAEVYHVTADASGFSIYFGLGERDGVGSGTRLLLTDPGRNSSEEITVEAVSETDAVARLGSLSKVRPGYLVKKI